MREFNTAGLCVPNKHYMVDISGKLSQIMELIEKGKYFTINRGRQYGKTTTFFCLEKALGGSYVVASISFEGVSDGNFESETDFVRMFVRLIARELRRKKVSAEIIRVWEGVSENAVNTRTAIDALGGGIANLCESLGRPMLLMVDEVDKCSDNPTFLSFLGMLRNQYLERQAEKGMAFHSVILAGVYDIKNLKLKLSPDAEKKYNSPWNIAADFNVDMSFSAEEIATMLEEYEEDYHTGMDIKNISRKLYFYTGGYPYLVSWLCKWVDEEGGGMFSEENVRAATEDFLRMKNPLIDDLMKKVHDYPDFKSALDNIILNGAEYPYTRTNAAIDLGVTFGVFCCKDNKVAISNIIFERLLYDNRIVEKITQSKMGVGDRSQFVTDAGRLDMKQVLLKFQEVMQTEYRKKNEKFYESQGGLLLLCFLKPIINGTGSYFVEPQTRNNGRMDMDFFELGEQELYFRNDGELLRIRPWGRNSFRVEASVVDRIPAGDAALLPVEGGKEEVEVRQIDERRAEIKNGKITAELFVQEWGNGLQMTFYDQRGEVLFREIANGGALTRRARKFRPLPGGACQLTVTFESDRNEKIFGMGQYQQEIMDLKGCNLELAHRNSQASIPFYISSLGYGFLWHNAAVGEVHFGKNTTEWIAGSTEKMDYWITAGDTPAEIEKQYASVTGTAPMMPEYGLGFWQCKLRYYNQEEVVRIAEEYKKRQIPLDVLVIDYYHWPRCGDWRFDEEYFPNPKEMVDALHGMGIETMVSIWPQVDWRSENFEEMKQQGLLVKQPSGVDVQMIFHGNNVFMDATNPRTREYVWEKCRKNYADLGIRTFWLDEAEPEFLNYDYEQYRYYAGPVSQVGNIYPREYSRLFYEGQKENGQDDIVNLVRCAWVGSQRYGALVWSGDIWSSYGDFRKQICAGLHMGLCGIPWWTTDIGGFHGGDIRDANFRELLIRWFQFGTFLPVMRLHGLRQPTADITNKAGEVREWTGAENEVWSYGEDNCRIMVKFIRIREMMRGYTRSLMEETHRDGTPVMRTLFYEFPEDETCWDVTDEYLYGADILVAPVCHEHAVEREVYLPRGASWVHAGSGEAYGGGRSYLVKAPIDTLPVFLRNGAQEYLVGQV